MRSEARTVEEYFAEIEPDRREVLRPVYDVVHAAMPDGYAETIAWGMIGWGVPLERYPKTYNGQPLAYASLAAQKRHYALYLMGLYSDPDRQRAFRDAWESSGRKLDMGKSCLLFRRVEELDLDLIRDTVASVPVDAFIATYERARSR
jgi:uncharacterized protein YdhG (YjbR/CyaY superfamily)